MKTLPSDRAEFKIANAGIVIWFLLFGDVTITPAPSDRFLLEIVIIYFNSFLSFSLCIVLGERKSCRDKIFLFDNIVHVPFTVPSVDDVD